MEKRQRRKWRSNDRAWIRNKLTAAKDASIPIARLKRFTSDGTRTFAAWPPLVRWSATIGPTKPGVCISDSWNCGIFCGRGKSFFNNCSPPRTASSEPSPRRKKNIADVSSSILREIYLVARSLERLIISRFAPPNSIIPPRLSYDCKRCGPLATDSLQRVKFSKRFLLKSCRVAKYGELKLIERSLFR